MDKREAKVILLGYRPGNDRAMDPQLDEALTCLERDPELARWFAEQQRADDSIRAAIRRTTVPAALKERILAQPKVVRVDFRWWKPVLLAGAAAVIIFGLVVEWSWLSKPAGGFAEYRAQMVQYISSGYLMSVKANSFDELRRVLAEKQWPNDFVVPDGLRHVTVIGGGVLQYSDHKVALACMKQDGHGVWLFVIQKRVLRGDRATKVPRVETVNGLPTATWSQGEDTYLLTAQGDEVFLKQFLPN